MRRRTETHTPKLSGTMRLPDAFVAASLSALPAAERPSFLSAMEEPAVRGLRLRPSVKLDEVRSVLPTGAEQVPWAENAYYLDGDSAAGAHPLHAAGAYYLQEPSAMAAVSALDVRPGQRVLDLCAAPGGKSTQIGAALGGHGVLVSNEPVSGRARILSQNIERMGIPNAVVTCAAPERLQARWGAWFDRVLVDAPCSGEGMFRREPGTRSQWSAESPGGCAARQRHILQAAAGLLHPGGLLVYATCTFNELENERQIEAFLAEHPDFSAEDFALEGVGTAAGGCLRLWPHCLKGEGHFVARLRKAGAARALSRAAERVQLAPLEGAASAALPGELVRQGDRAWLLPGERPDLSGIRALRSGLALGEWRGRVFVPDHAAALALPPETFARAHAVSPEDAARYLRGETLAADACWPGYTAILLDGFALGWAKCVDGMLKNLLPKGLRRMK